MVEHRDGECGALILDGDFRKGQVGTRQLSPARSLHIVLLDHTLTVICERGDGDKAGAAFALLLLPALHCVHEDADAVESVNEAIEVLIYFWV